MMCAGWGGPPRLLPFSRMETYQRPAKTIPRSVGHRREWVEACLAGKPQDAKSGFWYSAPFTEALLVGLLPEAKSVATALAGYKPVCVVEDDGNTLQTLFPRLSTVTIDTDERLIYQTWHLTLPRDFAARHIVLGSLVPPPEHCGDLRRKFAKDTAHG